MQCFRRCLLGICLAALLAGCTGAGRAGAVVGQMQQTGFVPQLFTTPVFTLYGLLRAPHPTLGPGDAALHVYIEGDGHAWASRTQPSSNPTPKAAVMLRLAQHDPGPHAVLYLARPCQFVSGRDARMCSPKYWTASRFAPEVIDSVNTAIDMAKSQVGARHIAVIGFSGGGTVATLVAAQRSDVFFLGTVAGMLDHTAWTQHHKVSSLSGSRNALQVVDKVRGVRQRHMTSTDDTIVPPSVNTAFCNALGREEACVTVRGLQHAGAWERVWPYTYEMQPLSLQ